MAVLCSGRQHLACRMRPAWPKAQRDRVVYAATGSLSVLSDGARLGFAPANAKTVCVAGVRASQAGLGASNQHLPQETCSSLAAGKAVVMPTGLLCRPQPEEQVSRSSTVAGHEPQRLGSRCSAAPVCAGTSRTVRSGSSWANRAAEIADESADAWLPPGQLRPTGSAGWRARSAAACQGWRPVFFQATARPTRHHTTSDPPG